MKLLTARRAALATAPKFRHIDVMRAGVQRPPRNLPVACHIRLFGGPHRGELYVEIASSCGGCDAKSVRLNTGAMRIEVKRPTLCAVLCRGWD